ncbi:MAG: acetyl-CoA acetyltransferase [Pseudomonadota bacterium]
MPGSAVTPVIVGVAQLEQRIQEYTEGKEPADLMIDALRAAAEDCGNPGVLDAAGSVRVIRGIWPYKNPARYVADALGLGSVETALSPYGGNYVQTTTNLSCLDIQSGAHDVILITGAECGNTQAKARRAGTRKEWMKLPGTPDRLLGDDKPMNHEVEAAAGIRAPIQFYPMFETALRHALGHGVEEHQAHIARLWAGFSAVAADNPHAWIRSPVSAEEIATPSASNRPVSFPYPKFMNSNNNVDQAAALIVCSTDKARALGIPESKWVYPHAGTDATDHLYVSHRDTLFESPAIRFAGRRVLELAGVTADDLKHIDVYSCFPVAVQVAARELGLSLERPLTVTGGLTFAGGPLNNYVMHSIARTVELLREDADAKALVTANGGYLTKHAFGVYSATPPAHPFQHEDLQAQVDAELKRDVVKDASGTATVEGYAVMYGAKGPEIAHVAARLPGGERCWANCRDTDTLNAMIANEFCGRDVHIKDGAAAF